jgi:hypothetical protein
VSVTAPAEQSYPEKPIMETYVCNWDIAFHDSRDFIQD